MSMQAYDFAALFNGISLHGMSFPLYSALLIDAASEYVAFVVRAPKTGNISTIRIRLGTVTTGQTLKAGIYTVDASGIPTATAFGGMVAGTLAVQNNDDNIEAVFTLSTSASVTKNDLIAVKIEFNSTIGNLNIQTAPNIHTRFPYTVHNGAKANGTPTLALGYDDSTYPQILGALPYTSNYGTISFAVNNATADEYAQRITLPFKSSIIGAYITGISIAAGCDFELILYNGTTAERTEAFDGDQVGATGSAAYVFMFDSPVEVPANSLRRLAIRPTTTTSIVVGRGIVGTAASLIGGSDAHLSRRVDQGSWDDSFTLEQLFILPIFDQLSDDAGGGSSIIRPRPVILRR